MIPNPSSDDRYQQAARHGDRQRLIRELARQGYVVPDHGPSSILETDGYAEGPNLKGELAAVFLGNKYVLVLAQYLKEPPAWKVNARNLYSYSTAKVWTYHGQPPPDPFWADLQIQQWLLEQLGQRRQMAGKKEIDPHFRSQGNCGILIHGSPCVRTEGHRGGCRTANSPGSTDQRMRDLQRRAALGDQAAAAELRAMEARTLSPEARLAQELRRLGRDAQVYKGPLTNDEESVVVNPGERLFFVSTQGYDDWWVEWSGGLRGKKGFRHLVTPAGMDAQRSAIMIVAHLDNTQPTKANPQRRQNPDHRMRDLQRRAQLGDRDAAAQLQAMQSRVVGQPAMVFEELKHLALEAERMGRRQIMEASWHPAELPPTSRTFKDWRNPDVQIRTQNRRVWIDRFEEYVGPCDVLQGYLPRGPGLYGSCTHWFAEGECHGAEQIVLLAQNPRFPTADMSAHPADWTRLFRFPDGRVFYVRDSGWRKPGSPLLVTELRVLPLGTGHGKQKRPV